MWEIIARENYLMKTIFTIIGVFFLFGCLGIISGERPDGEIIPLSFTSDFKVPANGPRYVALISDSHMGLGWQGNLGWHPTEDFRWPKALKSLLQEVSWRGNNKVDLVIVGDFLELWQSPNDIEKCKRDDPKPGHSVDDMKRIATIVVEAHSNSMIALREFSQIGENRLYIIPGNHDSSLLLADVWKPVGKKLEVEKGRVKLVENGIWVSQDGRIVAEHGHQIDGDVNSYKYWPNILEKNSKGKYYLSQPWGESFVQNIFNCKEIDYPIIDNLSPVSAGVRYHMANRGFVGSIKDIAKFIAFNIWETSINQKVTFLGEPPDNLNRSKWNISLGRKMGHELFANALPKEDPFRILLLADNSESKKLRAELDELANDPKKMPNEQIGLLCDHLAIQKSTPNCFPPDLGSLIKSNLIPRRWILREHLTELQKQKQFKRMQYFIYGHTHKLEEKWPIRLNGLVKIDVLNTGAFQRVINEKGFLFRIRKEGIKPEEGLQKIKHDMLPPCYGIVLVDYKDNYPNAETKFWYSPESGKSRIVSPTNPLCR